MKLSSPVLSSLRFKVALALDTSTESYYHLHSLSTVWALILHKGWLLPYKRYRLVQTFATALPLNCQELTLFFRIFIRTGSSLIRTLFVFWPECAFLSGCFQAVNGFSWIFHSLYPLLPLLSHRSIRFSVIKKKRAWFLYPSGGFNDEDNCSSCLKELRSMYVFAQSHTLIVWIISNSPPIAVINRRKPPA